MDHTEEADGTGNNGVDDGGDKHKCGRACCSPDIQAIQNCAAKKVVIGRVNGKANITAGQDNSRRQT